MVNKSPLPNPTKADAEYISCVPPCNKIFQKFYNGLAAGRQRLNGRSNGFSFNPNACERRGDSKSHHRAPNGSFSFSCGAARDSSPRCNRGFGQTHISKAPDGAAENRFEMHLNLPPRPGLEF
jgi:hypothetical protein